MPDSVIDARYRASLAPATRTASGSIRHERAPRCALCFHLTCTGGLRFGMSRQLVAAYATPPTAALSTKRTDLVVAHPWFIGDDPWTVEVDVGSLVEHLLLFDQIVLQSVRMKEFDALVRSLGLDELLLLLESDRFHVVNDHQRFADMSGYPDRTDGRGVLPLSHFSMGYVAIRDQQSHVERDLDREIGRIDVLSKSQASQLRDALASRCVSPPGFASSDDAQLAHEAERAVDALRHVIRQLSESRLNRSLDNEQLHVAVHREVDTILVIEHNLGDVGGLPATVANALLRHALFGLSETHTRLSYMRHFDAVSGFAAGERAYVDARLSHLIDIQDPEQRVKAFRSAVTATAVPSIFEIVEQGERRVDLRRVLEVADSPECREFRSWLDTFSGSEDDLAERMGGLRGQMSRAVGGTNGRALRHWIVEAINFTTLGPIPQTALSSVDRYLVDRYFGRPGPVLFLTETYPSIFE